VVCRSPANVGLFGALDEHVVHLLVGVDLALVAAQLKLLAVDVLHRAAGGGKVPLEHLLGAAGTLVLVVDAAHHQFDLALQVF
jgi:hypothetical protein